MSEDHLETALQQIVAYAPIHAHLATSGQPTAAQLLLIKEMGYQSVINLALSDASNHLPNEDRICLDLGLDYLQFPLLWDAPNPSMGVLILDLLHFLVQEQKVWLHCAKNFRVSSLIYLYRRYYLGVDEEHAQHALAQIWQPDETWTGFMHAIQLQLQARQSTNELSQIS